MTVLVSHCHLVLSRQAACPRRASPWNFSWKNRTENSWQETQPWFQTHKLTALKEIRLIIWIKQNKAQKQSIWIKTFSVMFLTLHTDKIILITLAVLTWPQLFFISFQNVLCTWRGMFPEGKLAYSYFYLYLICWYPKHFFLSSETPVGLQRQGSPCISSGSSTWSPPTDPHWVWRMSNYLDDKWGTPSNPKTDFPTVAHKGTLLCCFFGTVITSLPTGGIWYLLNGWPHRRATIHHRWLTWPTLPALRHLYGRPPV